MKEFLNDVQATVYILGPIVQLGQKRVHISMVKECGIIYGRVLV